MNKLKIQGKELSNENQKEQVIPIQKDYLTLSQVIEVNALRFGNKAVNINIENEDDIVDIEFDDGAEWIGSAFDFTEIFGGEIQNKRDSTDSLALPSSLIGGDDRGLKEIGIKLISLFTGNETLVESVAKKTAKELGEEFDKRIMPNTGLFKIGKDLKPQNYQPTSPQGQHFLLFIHGTASSTEVSFGGLSTEDKEDKEDKIGVWDTIESTYKDNILTLQHRTVSVSPIKNAIDTLKALPDHCSLDIISHSRGGIVADILARCDKRNEHPGFTAQELAKMEKEDNSSYELIKEINALCKIKALSVNKVIRVACPAQGTTLLSERLDHFLNGLLRAVGLALGGKINPVYQLIRSFIVDVIKARATPDVMPGLNAMIPNSTFQQVINNPHVLVKSHLAVVEGNAEIGSDIKQSILVIFSNLFYWAANDFVVNTKSMRYGARRENGYHLFLSKDHQTSHFNYFKNNNSLKAISNAIKTNVGTPINGYTHTLQQNTDRGIALGFINMGEVARDRDQISGSKPIVILIPGIMGSNLEVNGEKIWIDFEQINNGKLRTLLSADKGNVKAKSLIGDYYESFVLELLKQYDVHTLAFDWRLSVKKPASELNDLIKQLTRQYDQPIKIIAHSMGGLVVRQVMLDYSDDWNTYINAQGSQFMMLGTPWLGSYLIMEVLTGYSSKVKQLALLDFENSTRELLDVFAKYQGIFELLPIDNIEFESASFWSDLDKKIGGNNFPTPDKNELDQFKAYKNKVQETNFDFTNTYYIAGKNNSTTFNYKITKSWFGKKIKFLPTPDGDGSVTWESGIPDNFPTENLYYTNTEHGELANDNRLFDGLLELLKEGTTSHFQKSRPISRGSVATLASDETISNDPKEAMGILFGIRGHDIDYEQQVDELEVSVNHAHLQVSKYPLMVGHFVQDGIVSAEGVLDSNFSGKLSERHLIGNYPGEIGESEVLIISGNKPIGVVVIGLGDNTKLTSYNLMKTVESGVISYAMHLRDSCTVFEKDKFSDGISSLCIGSSYGSLPMENSLSAILKGINRANTQMKQLNSNLQIIKKVEFIELYEHLARKAYFSLKRIQKNHNELRIQVQGFTTRHGARKKLKYVQDDFWWHDFTTEFAKNKDMTDKPRLIFKSSLGIARVEEETLFPAQPVVDALLQDLSVKPDWNAELSKTLFEILIPNNFKEIIRTQNNILWKLDVETAAYPWEMFHDNTTDKEPTFVNAGLIRQLATDSYRPNPKVTRTKKALVIGDPLYTNMALPQLPSAKLEAQTVTDKLRHEDFHVEDLIGEQGVKIINSIFNAEYKILHVAGHGIYNPEENQVGAALGNGMFLSPELIKSLSNVPEFVFINCCYSGTIDSAFEKYYQDRYKLAANLGTQLIRMGVNAAVITGWAVNDPAANLFANTLYERLLAGYHFGESVQAARKACYLEYRHTNTWGAYQCYGDPWYKLVKKSHQSSEVEEYISEQQVVVDLSNLLSKSECGNHQTIVCIQSELEDIIKRAKKHTQYTGTVIEKEAEIYAAIDEQELAVDRYQTLLHLNKATFSIKSLEQFCNLRAKLLVKQQRSDADSINKLLADLKTLLFIGKTPERLNILGNAYKRIAQLYKGNDRKESLKTMADYYQEAYELSKSKQCSLIYPLTNWLTSYALSGSGNRKIEIDGKTLSPPDHLLRHQKISDLKSTTNEDFWTDIELVNLLMCQLLFAKGANKINHLKNRIICLYKDAWKIGGSYKHARTEIEHIEFILAIWEDETSNDKQRILKTLEEVKNELEKLMA